MIDSHSNGEEAPPPTRSFMDDPDISWKYAMPDFSVVNRKYMAERTMSHKAGSLEKIVENLVKTWEMESTHKTDLKDWGTIDVEKFRISSNGGRTFTGEDNVQYGNYMMLMWDSPFFDINKETNEGALKNFKTAFPGGFAWEVLKVLSGPPSVSFTWRHWADWTGPYKGVEPTGEKMELTGMALAEVTDELKVMDFQVFYDPNPFMFKLLGLDKDEDSKSACPFH